jgi:hypothetical protein
MGYCLEMEARIQIENNQLAEAMPPLKRALEIM